MAGHTQSLLNALIAEEFPSMLQFAKSAGVTQSLVWRDCQGRQLSDKRFLAYLRVLSPDGRKRLIRARLRDILTDEFMPLVGSGKLDSPGKKSSNLSLLSPDSQAAIEKLAGEMAQDRELHDWVMQFVRKVC